MTSSSCRRFVHPVLPHRHIPYHWAYAFDCDGSLLGQGWNFFQSMHLKFDLQPRGLRRNGAYCGFGNEGTDPEATGITTSHR